ncbi:MAG TPA: DoxX family membrane protein [Polyangia bacterium]|nr:DoxX family membrane protein [Polyangia bacterium]
MNATRRYVPTAARLVLGLVFTTFGLNFFLHFLPMPPPPPKALAAIGGLLANGYLMPLAHVIEVVAGVLLLTGLFVPLALTLLAPIIVNIVAFHAAVAPSGLGLGVLVLALEIGLGWAYRGAFAPMLRARTPLPAAMGGHRATEDLRAVA